MDLNGKVALITGGGSGIGRAIAIRFAKEGAKVAIADCNAASGEETAAAIRRDGKNCIFFQTDVSHPTDVEKLVGQVVESHGKLNVLINNAAIQIMGKLVDTSEEDWDRLHSVNMKGVFLCCKYAIPAIINAGGGAIVNMGSLLGLLGDPDMAAYCAAKGGVIALTKAAAIAYGPLGIRVNCVCPGDVDTSMLQDFFNRNDDPVKMRQDVCNKYPLRRIASPAEIAETALFLASDASSFMTGSVLVVDGGLSSRSY